MSPRSIRASLILIPTALLMAACSATGAPSATVTASPTGSPVAASPSGSPAASTTPGPADLTAAVAAVGHYEASIAKGDYAAAWAMLAPSARLGTLAAFSSERAAYFRTMGGRYALVPQPTNVAPIGEWVSAANGASIDLSHAVLVEVDYPARPNDNAAWELFIAQPASGGEWELYQVR